MSTPNKKLKLPSHIAHHYTARQWKDQKRKELKAVIKLFNAFRLGCAYTPSYDDAARVQAALDRMQKACSVKEWGR